MNPVEYFKDMSREFRAVQNRIRNLIGDAHWPSDGAWKESVLRTCVRRYLPPSFVVGSGFIVTPDGVSNQIDLLICSDAAPILFRDGDFIITTADAVRAAVEVKTHISGAELRDALIKLNNVSHLVRLRCVHPKPFLGLFSYDATETPAGQILECLQETHARISDYPIRAMCFGGDSFYRFWEYDPREQVRRQYNSWHAYELPEMAPGYFVHNLVAFLFPNAVERAEQLWYPADGKEGRLVGTKARGAPRAPKGTTTEREG
ncbi:MAG: DUF6602 domain-containing protein [Kiritimatiellia bacterium]